ncbi:MAG: hypothetical protein LBG90_08060 [Spirochaetaceae bacterium]|jgi:tetratricopeptide (TPR) repeat protein|nr:hypothetical protein [Spirochaetaceae bacterium]
MCLLFLILIGCGVFFIILKGKNPFSQAWDGEAFYRELSEFDARLVKSENFEKPEILNRALDKLERKALSAESHLSVLKRRRLLAHQDPRFIPAYQRAAQAAADALPSAEALAAVAVEALLLGNPSDEAGRTNIRTYGARITEPDLQALVLGLYIILGDFQDPAKAFKIPNKETLFSAPLPETDFAGPAKHFPLALDVLLLQIMAGDTPGALGRINTFLHNTELMDQNPELSLLVAEFFYDFDAPIRAAEIFSRFSDARSLARQADALWISGFASGSRNIWNLLLSPERSGEIADTGIISRTLYNLAASTENIEERRTNLRTFMEAGTQRDEYYVYGLIYYSRLLDTLQGIRTLEAAQIEYSGFLLNLELLRRRSEIWSIDQAVAETWLLLNQYPEDPRIYQWACYFFDLQRRYDETAELIRQAGYRHITGPWIDFHDSLRLIRAGQTEEALKRLKAIFPPNFIWQIPGNIARINEANHETAAALEYYETAAALVTDKKSASRILFRMSRCFRVLGKDQESKYALEESIRFDPDYLDARLELQRRETL